MLLFTCAKYNIPYSEMLMYKPLTNNANLRKIRGKVFTKMKNEKWIPIRKRHQNGPQDLITVSLCTQIAIDKIQLRSLSLAYACPYYNPTTTIGQSVHNIGISKPIVHTTPYTYVVWGCMACWTYCQIL
jgi:hypothetical protein